MGNEDYTMNNEKNIDDEDDNGNSFRDYAMESKVHKSSLKKKMAQAKRLLVNQASKEYSQVHEQQDKKSVPKMLVSVSKINGLKALVNTKTKKYGKATSPTYLSGGLD